MTRITIPTSEVPRIRIPAKIEKPQRKPVGDVERIGVSIPRAAEMAGVSVTGISPYIKDGTIRAVRFGKRVIVSVQSIRDYIDGKKMPRDPVEMEISTDESRGGEVSQHSTAQ
jgi:hypothetical protein